MEHTKEKIYNKDGKLLGYWTAVSMNDEIEVVFMEPLEYQKYESKLNRMTPEQKRKIRQEYDYEYRNRPEMKDKIRIRKQKYNEEHKDEMKEKKQVYREKNKEKLNSKLSCECGSVYSYTNKNKHMKTLKHLKYIEETKFH